MLPLPTSLRTAIAPEQLGQSFADPKSQAGAAVMRVVEASA